MLKKSRLYLEYNKWQNIIIAVLKRGGLILFLTAICGQVRAGRLTSPAAEDVDTAVCLSPVSSRAQAVMYNSAMLVWHGDAAQYEYAYMRSEYSQALSLLSDGITIDDTIVMIEGLRPNTSYSFYVRSRCGESVSRWSQALTFRTCPLQTKLPYNQDFRSCGVGGVATLPSGWGAYSLGSNSNTSQPDHRSVFPVLRDSSKGTKNLALTVDSIAGAGAGLVRGYAVMPLFSTTDKQQYTLGIEGYSSRAEGTRMLIGLADSSAKGVLLMPLDTVQLYDEVESFEITLSKDLLEGNHIVFCILGSLDTMVGIPDTAFLCSVSVVSVLSEQGTPDPPHHYCPFPVVSQNIKTTLNSAEVKWKGQASQYEIKWNNSTTGESLGPIMVSGSSYTISGLSPNTRYMVSVRSVCENQRYSAWNSSSFITKSKVEPKSCPVPVNFHLVDIGMYNVTFDWTPVGNETSWVVKVWNKDGSWIKTADYHPFTFGTNARSDIMREPDDLHRCVEYHAAIHPICDMGWDYVPYENWEFSQPVTFKSKCCPDVENLRIGRVRETAVCLEWEGRTNDYDVMFADITDPLSDIIWEERIYNNGVGTFPDPNLSQTRSFWLDDLLPYRKYEIRVGSECNDGTYGEYAKVIVETPPYILTEAGVDILQIGQPFLITPLKGCIYDRAEFKSKGDNGTYYYNLMSKGREIGTAIVFEGHLFAFSITHPGVMVEGGIFENTPIVQAFEKRYGVFSKSEFDWAFEMIFTTINLVGNNKIWVLVENKNDLSISGRKKIQKIEHEVDLLDGRIGLFDDLDEMEYQKRFTTRLLPSDFKETATIKQFEVGTTLILCP